MLAAPSPVWILRQPLGREQTVANGGDDEEDAVFRVVQTVSAFRYPEGKIWGPYADRIDASDRVALLREFGGDGVIESGEFGAPCGLRLVDAGGGGGGLLVAA